MSAAAQTPPVGDVNFYGLRRITAERILRTIKLKPGDPLPPSKGELEDQIEKMSDVVQARVEAVCCEGANAILFIGIEEKGAPHAAFRSAPAGDATLPPDLMDSYREFLGAVQRSAARGNAAEDFTAGHSLMSDPEPRAFQQQFISFAAEHLDLLREVVRTASEPEGRAIAAAVIGYAPDKKEVVNDLQYALEDPSEPVRANAMRSLAAIAVRASKQPNLGIQISPTWLVELLNSVVLEDRTESVKALLNLTDHDNRSAIDRIRERALPALVEMARWKTLRYALPPFLLVGRIAGLPDDQVQQRWEQGAREPVIQQALGTAGRKRAH